jgi:hypothetical protein
MAIVLDGTSGITTPALDSTARFASADMPIGSVLQVVSATTTSPVSITTTTYTDSGLTASITPTSASSKILVLVSQQLEVDSLTNNSGAGLRILRGATHIYGGRERYEFYLESTGATRVNLYGKVSLMYLDSPSTTSSTTYKTQIASYQSGEDTSAQPDDMDSTITLMEIAA